MYFFTNIIIENSCRELYNCLRPNKKDAKNFFKTVLFDYFHLHNFYTKFKNKERLDRCVKNIKTFIYAGLTLAEMSRIALHCGVKQNNPFQNKSSRL